MSAAGLDLRAFGVEGRDLDVDFDDGDRAAVVTDLLARCAPLERDGARALPVGTRLHALVDVCRLSGADLLSWALTCPAAGCDEEIEIELPLAVLADAARDAEASEPPAVAWGEGSFRPRLPTGEDLRRWRAEPPSDAAIVAALGGPRFAGDEVPRELVAAVEAALEAADPLVDARVQSACPACGQPLDLAVDVEGEMLALARRGQDVLLEDVAALAGAFHWSEQDILALPARRRRRYLAMLERAA